MVRTWKRQFVGCCCQDGEQKDWRGRRWLRLKWSSFVLRETRRQKRRRSGEVVQRQMKAYREERGKEPLQLRRS